MLRTALLLVVLLHATPLLAAPTLTFCCSPQNDLYLALTPPPPRYDSPTDTANNAPDHTALLVLADAYPAHPTPLDENFFAIATRKHLRLYLEFPSTVPGVEFAAPTQATWER